MMHSNEEGETMQTSVKISATNWGFGTTEVVSLKLHLEKE